MHELYNTSTSVYNASFTPCSSQIFIFYKILFCSNYSNANICSAKMPLVHKYEEDLWEPSKCRMHAER